MTGDGRTDGASNVIIVGGGSAGAVLARRLSENSARKVLLLEAGKTYAPDGYPDVIGAEQDGVAPYPLNVVSGVRENTGIAYLADEVRRRPNLTIRGRTEVDRVLISQGKATGVVGVDGSTYHAREVILSAGTYGSAAILMRSAVGPAADLRRLDIEEDRDRRRMLESVKKSHNTL